MEVKVQRTYSNDFKYDDDEPDFYTEVIAFDSTTFDEVKNRLCDKRGLVRVDSLLKHVYENGIGKVTESGDTRFIPQLVMGDFTISIQCSYQLYSARLDKYGCDEASKLSDKPMTQQEWQLILGARDRKKRDDYPFDVYFDVCIFRKSDNHMLIRPCQMSMRMLALRIDSILKMHEITD